MVRSKAGSLDTLAMGSTGSQNQKQDTSLEAKRMLSSSKIASLQQEKVAASRKMLAALRSKSFI